MTELGQDDDPSPAVWRWIIGFLFVGAAWGFTTPFVRNAAVSRDQRPKPKRPVLTDAKKPWFQRKLASVFFAVFDLVRDPAYAVPLGLNITGSIWFFLLIGKAELSLTVPITNSLALLFTVLGEWVVDGKVITRDTWLGMALVLGGITLCVYCKLT